MTSIPQPGGHTPELPAYDALITAAEREIARQKLMAKQLRRARRRAKRAEAARALRAYSRAGFFWLGNTAVAASIVCFCLGESALATDLAKLALTAWLGAIQLPPRR
ncbi:hypothetical protein [Streptomyces sp. NPDC048361]|uniref:hypothetical protein n=1 Tax=Streptomyces sp. NPDC048361 TaxID=3154720 RepID=UPI003427607C